jgi:hypothetical protein
MLIFDDYFNTPVLGATSGIIRSISIGVRGDRIFLTVPLRRQVSFTHPVVSEFLADSRGTVFGQSQVVSLTTD